MKFEAAFNYLKHGQAVALPEWGGYWTWDDQLKTIKIHARNGYVFDMRHSPDMDYTIGFMFRDDWELVDDVSSTEHRQTSVDYAERALDRAIERAGKGGVVNLDEIMEREGGFDPHDLFYMAENAWTAGQLEQGASRKEYIVQ